MSAMAPSPGVQFQTDADRTTADEPRRAAVRKALGNYRSARGKTEHAFASWQHAREAAAEIKYEGGQSSRPVFARV